MSAPSRIAFLEELRLQRWDDHRYYHHSRINQSLHLVSALCFLGSYVAIFYSPVVAVMLGWIPAMLLRQSGHFFFEPKGYDTVNEATHQHKEAIKVGYNLRRKVILMSVWAMTPIVLWLRPDFFGLFANPEANGYLHNLCMLWLIVAAGAVLIRTGFLCATRSVQSGLVWATKILTDPFHDVKLYHKAPIHLLRGEMLDPMTDDWGHTAAPSQTS